MEQIEYARMNFFSCEYTRIAYEHLQKAQGEIVDLHSASETQSPCCDPWTQQAIHERNAIVWSIISVVFSAMSIESFIYNYAASHLSDSYVKAHLDSMNPVDKWIIIPRLITGKELDKSTHTYDLLKRVFSDRNKYVHNKSRPLNYDNAKPDDPHLYVSQAANGIKTIEYLAQFIQKIDPIYPVKSNFGIEWDTDE